MGSATQKPDFDSGKQEKATVAWLGRGLTDIYTADIPIFCIHIGKNKTNLSKDLN